MIDASANLYNALPRILGAARLPASRSLAKPDESIAGSNSLNSIANELRPESAVTDFSPASPGAQGFASLSPVLAALRPAPAQLSAPPENGNTTWEKLLETQQEIAEARRAAAEELQESEQARRQAAAERAAFQQTISAMSEKVIFTSEQQPSVENSQQASNPLQPGDEQTAQQAANNRPEPIPLPGQGNTSQPGTQQGEASGRLFQSANKPPQIPSAAAPKIASEPAINEAVVAEQRRVAKIFSTTQNSDNAGNTINLFA